MSPGPILSSHTMRSDALSLPLEEARSINPQIHPNFNPAFIDSDQTGVKDAHRDEFLGLVQEEERILKSQGLPALQVMLSAGEAAPETAPTLSAPKNKNDTAYKKQMADVVKLRLYVMQLRAQKFLCQQDNPFKVSTFIHGIEDAPGAAYPPAIGIPLLLLMSRNELPEELQHPHTPEEYANLKAWCQEVVRMASKKATISDKPINEELVDFCFRLQESPEQDKIREAYSFALGHELGHLIHEHHFSIPHAHALSEVAQRRLISAVAISVLTVLIVLLCLSLIGIPVGIGLIVLTLVLWKCSFYAVRCLESRYKEKQADEVGLRLTRTARGARHFFSTFQETAQETRNRHMFKKLSINENGDYLEMMLHHGLMSSRIQHLEQLESQSIVS